MEEIAKAIVVELYKNQGNNYHKLNTALMPYKDNWQGIRNAISSLHTEGIIIADYGYTSLGGSDGGVPVTLENLELNARLNGVKGINYYHAHYGDKKETSTIITNHQTFSNVSGSINLNQPSVVDSDNFTSNPTNTTTQNTSQKSWLQMTFEKIKAAFSKIFKWFCIAFIISFFEMWLRGAI